MRKLLFIVMVIGVCLLFPMKCKANEVAVYDIYSEVDILYYGQYLQEGYTEDGIHYTIYGDSTIMPMSSSSYNVTRTYIFDEIIVPVKARYYSEKKGGIYYGGTIYLISVQYESGKTIAVYSGTLYQIE